jgi:hypothetical protein
LLALRRVLAGIAGTIVGAIYIKQLACQRFVRGLPAYSLRHEPIPCGNMRLVCAVRQNSACQQGGAGSPNLPNLPN